MSNEFRSAAQKVGGRVMRNNESHWSGLIVAGYNEELNGEIKKNYNPILPSTFRALGWNVGQGTLQTLLQPVRLLCHSHRGPKPAYGGLPGFVQDGGYSREEPGRPLSHICPGPCAVFSCRCQRGYP